MNYKEHAASANANLLNMVKENMGNRRQQNKVNKVKNQHSWRVEIGGSHNIHDFQFWDEKTLDLLDDKRTQHFDAWTDADTQTRERLLNNPFKFMSKKEFTS